MARSSIRPTYAKRTERNVADGCGCGRPSSGQVVWSDVEGSTAGRAGQYCCRITTTYCVRIGNDASGSLVIRSSGVGGRGRRKKVVDYSEDRRSDLRLRHGSACKRSQSRVVVTFDSHIHSSSRSSINRSSLKTWYRCKWSNTRRI